MKYLRVYPIFLVVLILNLFHIDHLHCRNIFLFGDSHQGAFNGIPDCHSVLNDSITMHRVGRDMLGVLNLSSIPFANGDAVIFSFGQIDVGWHICKQRDLAHRSLDEIISTLATNYVNALKLIVEPYPNIIKIVYSVPPPSDIFIHQTLNLSYSGTLDERIKITKELNNLLKILCPMNGIEFLDVYDDYSNPNGTLRLEINDGSGYHIDSRFNGPIRYKLSEILQKYEQK